MSIKWSVHPCRVEVGGDIIELFGDLIKLIPGVTVTRTARMAQTRNTAVSPHWDEVSRDFLHF